MSEMVITRVLLLILMLVFSGATPDSLTSKPIATTDLVDHHSRQLFTLLKSDTVLKTLKRTYSSIRGFAAQAFATYNFYFAEISFSKCMGKYIFQTYPESAKATIESTARFLKTAKDMLSETMKTILGFGAENNEDYTAIGYKIKRISEPDMISYQTEKPFKNLNRNYTTLPDRSKELDMKNYFRTLWYPPQSSNNQLRRSGRQFVYPNFDEPVEPPPLPTSIFDFDDALKGYFGIGKIEKEPVTLQTCMKSYVLEVFWRTLEIILIKE